MDKIESKYFDTYLFIRHLVITGSWIKQDLSWLSDGYYPIVILYLTSL